VGIDVDLIPGQLKRRFATVRKPHIRGKPLDRAGSDRHRGGHDLARESLVASRRDTEGREQQAGGHEQKAEEGPYREAERAAVAERSDARDQADQTGESEASSEDCQNADRHGISWIEEAERRRMERCPPAPPG
jgi:hypothetical protein